MFSSVKQHLTYSHSPPHTLPLGVFSPLEKAWLHISPTIWQHHNKLRGWWAVDGQTLITVKNSSTLMANTITNTTTIRIVLLFIFVLPFSLWSGFCLRVQRLGKHLSTRPHIWIIFSYNWSIYSQIQLHNIYTYLYIERQSMLSNSWCLFAAVGTNIEIKVFKSICWLSV